MTTDLESSNLLTVGQVAGLLSIHPNTVRRWSKKGVLESYRIGSRGDQRFKKEDVNTLLFESWLFDYDKVSINRKNNLLVRV
jgi:excisionase family DNA binding protein